MASTLPLSFPHSPSEVGIYKRQQEIKKKQELDQESDQEKKERKHALDQERKTFLFLYCFPGREHVFFLFLTFLFSFMNLISVCLG